MVQGEGFAAHGQVRCSLHSNLVIVSGVWDIETGPDLSSQIASWSQLCIEGLCKARDIMFCATLWHVVCFLLGVWLEPKVVNHCLILSLVPGNDQALPISWLVASVPLLSQLCLGKGPGLSVPHPVLTMRL